MILVLSLVFGLVPLVGVVWIFLSGMISLSPPSATVDGLFMTLILLTVSFCFLLNVYWEARDKGLIPSAQKKKNVLVPAAAPAGKSPTANAVPVAKVPTAKVSS